MAQSAEEIRLVTEPSEVNELVSRIREERTGDAFLCELGGGVLRFVDSVFPSLARDEVFAQINDREPEGRGAHFDVYKDYVREDYPLIAVYNLRGAANLAVLDLPDDLAASYFDKFPEPTDEAFDARRAFSQIALLDSRSVIANGRLNAGTGLILPQTNEGPQIVHDIVPVNPAEPGRFVKFVAPNNEEGAQKKIRNGSYDPIDLFITRELSSGTVLDEVVAVSGLDLGTSHRSTARARRRCSLD